MGKDAEREDLEERLASYLKGALKQAGVTYEELAKRLEGQGFNETKASIASKLGRGSFSATFFIAAMKVTGRDKVDLSNI